MTGGIRAGRITFRDGSLDGGDGERLEAAMRAEVEAMYEGLDMRGAYMPSAGPAQFAAPHGAFLVGYLDGEAVCCGGVKRLSAEPAICELKRMYVVPSVRGSGVARQLLTALEDLARGRGYRIVRLTTGPSQPSARGLYESAGYVEVADFNGDPFAAFFGEKVLSA